jgi:signal transduction histidine kinase
VREVQRPPLHARLRPVDLVGVDAAVAVAYLGALAGWVLPRVPQLPAHGTGPPGLPAALDWVAALLITVPVAVRRLYPWPALGMAAVGAVLAMMGGLHPAPFPTLAYVLYWVATTQPRRPAAAGLAVALCAVITAFITSTSLTSQAVGGSGSALPSFLFTGLAQVAAWAIGRSVRQHRAYSRGLAEQAARKAQAEIDAARTAVTEQRLQIARDLHDVVAHSVSLMTVQAGAARMLADTRPGDTRELLTAIETTGRECLRETRRVLGVLREETSSLDGLVAGQVADADLSPAPGLAELSRLVERSATAGLTVQVEFIGVRRALPATVEVTAYRIIREALTNIIRHSTADHSQVALTYGASELSIEVINPPTGSRIRIADSPGAGHGLIGMRERVLLHGGKFRAGHAEGGGFAVTATLPLPEVTA